MSLLFGVIANASVFLIVDDDKVRISELGLQFIIATIICGETASIILIALTAAASTHLRLLSPPNHAWTEAYYYAIMAAALYFITSTFMIYTAKILWGKDGKGNRARTEIKLAKGHHRIMVLTVCFMAYILIGGLVFSHIEGWSFLNTVYWADVTLLTIGFGDFNPQTNLGRGLVLPFTAVGIAILFLTIYCIPKLVFERGSLWMQEWLRIRRMKSRKRKMEAPNTKINESKVEDSKVSSEESLEEMKKILQHIAKRYFWLSVITWVLIWISLWLIGATIFWASERSQDWSFFQAIYFAFMALLVVGYGDLTLQSNSGRAAFVLWSLIAIPTWTMLITTLVEAVGSPYIKGGLKGMKDFYETKVQVMKNQKSRNGTGTLSLI